MREFFGKLFVANPQKQKTDENKSLIKVNKIAVTPWSIEQRFEVISGVLLKCTKPKIKMLQDAKVKIYENYDKLILNITRHLDPKQKDVHTSEMKVIKSYIEELKENIIQALYSKYVIKAHCLVLESYFRLGYIQAIENKIDVSSCNQLLKNFFSRIEKGEEGEIKELTQGLSNAIVKCNQVAIDANVNHALPFPKFNSESQFLTINLPEVETANQVESIAIGIVNQLFTAFLNDVSKTTDALHITTEYREGAQDNYDVVGGFTKAREEILKEYKSSISLEQLLESACQQLAERKLSGGVGSEGETQESVPVVSVEHQEDDHHNEHGAIEILIPSAE
jgi:hypothetical protein